MQNQSDQELDDLFKRAAEQSEGDSAMPDWTDMNKRLDKETHVGFFRQNKAVITGSILVLAVAVLVWWGLDTGLAGDEVRATADEVQRAKDSEHGAPLKSIESKASEVGVSEPSSPSSRKDDNRLMSDKKDVVPESNSSSKPEKVSRLTRANKGVDDVKISREGKRDLNNEKKASLEGNKNIVVGNISDESRENKIADQRILDQRNPVSSSSNQWGLVLTDSVAAVEELAREPEETVAEDNKDVGEKNDEPAKAYRGLSVKLVVSPDYSTVKSTQPDKLGVNYGLLVEYGLTKNLSVAAGLIRSNKFYSAYDIEYYGQASDRVDGDCRMWDVPLMLYYTFSPHRTWSLYAGLGVSSYLMSKENYVYYVEGGYGNVYTYEKTIRGKNNEWFSMLNLSVGLNKQLNTRWAIQLEPFYKAPLAGVGEGDVSLASLGAFFNLKYNFLNKKQIRL